MFFVNDTVVQRHKKIQAFVATEPVIAVLLGAADFEWTVRRAIIALGESPNMDIREKTLNGCHGLDAYKTAWKKEIQPRYKSALAEVIPQWQFFREQAYPLRHKIIHGVIGTVGADYAGERIAAMLNASRALCEFAGQHDCDLYQRLKVRRRKATSQVAI
ncbi:MAG: hypothetical protein U0939_22220 [Pirellulales bacterium]